MRAVFFGTAPIAVPALQALARLAEIGGVVCQPDRPAGRGLELAEPAVKVAARELGLPVHQPTRVRDGALAAWLAAQAADVALVMAYGRILPADVLRAPRRGCLNLHASLLPRHRGAAPLQWTIAAGDAETGVCLMQMDEGMDTGPVYGCRRLTLAADETAGTLAPRLAALAAEVVEGLLPAAVAGTLTAVAQDPARATHAPPLTPEDAHLRLDRPAAEVERWARAMAPRPGAWALLGGKRLKLGRLSVLAGPAGDPPGTLRVIDDRVTVACGEGRLRLDAAQLEGRRMLPAADLVNGRALRDGDVLA